MRCAVAMALVGCGQEYELGPVATDPVVEVAPPAIRTDGHGHGQGTAPLAVSKPAVEVELGGDAPATVVDYLFVVDGSQSMESVIQRVFDGVDAIAAEGDVFPPDARIAVMGTTPSAPGHPERVHGAAPKEAWLALEPGFGDPVDAARIERFRLAAPDEWSKRFDLDGCDAWFAPSDRDAEGVPCLVAHTQESLYPIRVEAGLTALGQRLAQDRPLFRAGAAVNVIFVSDTHDPGLPPDNRAYEGLVAVRPTFERLAGLAAWHHDLASFRVHAVAPASACTTEEAWTGDLAYFDVAEASGGRTLDVCTATPADYVAMVRAMVVEGAVPQRAVVPIGPAASVSQVTVDGVAVPFALSRDRTAVVLRSLPAKRSRVAVELAPGR